MKPKDSKDFRPRQRPVSGDLIWKSNPWVHMAPSYADTTRSHPRPPSPCVGDQQPCPQPAPSLHPKVTTNSTLEIHTQSNPTRATTRSPPEAHVPPSLSSGPRPGQPENTHGLAAAHSTPGWSSVLTSHHEAPSVSRQCFSPPSPRPQSPARPSHVFLLLLPAWPHVAADTAQRRPPAPQLQPTFSR